MASDKNTEGTAKAFKTTAPAPRADAVLPDDVPLNTHAPYDAKFAERLTSLKRRPLYKTIWDVFMGFLLLAVLVMGLVRLLVQVIASILS